MNVNLSGNDKWICVKKGNGIKIAKKSTTYTPVPCSNNSTVFNSDLNNLGPPPAMEVAPFSASLFCSTCSESTKELDNSSSFEKKYKRRKRSKKAFCK